MLRPSASSPASSKALMRSASNTHPPHVPPLARCKTDQRRLSCGRRVRGEVRDRGTVGEDASGFFGAEGPGTVAHQIDAAFQAGAINDNADAVAVAQLADRAAGQASGRHDRCTRRWKRQKTARL